MCGCRTPPPEGEAFHLQCHGGLGPTAGSGSLCSSSVVLLQVPGDCSPPRGAVAALGAVADHRVERVVEHAHVRP